MDQALAEAPFLSDVLPSKSPPRATLETFTVHERLDPVEVVKRASHVLCVSHRLVPSLNPHLLRGRRLLAVRLGR